MAKSRWMPVLQLASGAVLISFSPVFVKLAGIGPSAIAFYRVFIGGIILSGLVVIGRTSIRIGSRALALAGICGLMLAADLILWHSSIELIGPGLATIMGNFQVFVLAGYGVLVLRERLTPRLAVAIPLALVGLFLIFGLEWAEVQADYKLGVGLGLLTAATYGGFLIVLRKVQSGPEAPDPTVTLATLSLVAAMFLPVVVQLRGESLRVADADTWVWLVSYAIVSHVIGWMLISRALPRVQASRVGLILLLQPSLAFVWDVVLFGRPTEPLELVGASVALGAIYLGTAAPPK